ncbi:MAG: hypothetical protein R3C19_08470 [Planctomycetaceae bacterium]
MKAAFPKLATIVLAITSVMLMGASIAAYYGRPDARTAMFSPELQDYNFESSGGDSPSWTVTSRIGAKDNVGQSPNAYEAVVKARAHLSQRLGNETSEMTQKVSEIRAEIERITVQQQQDMEALNTRIQTLTGVANGYDQELKQKSQELQALSVEGKATRDETAQRRQDVVRLQNQLEEIRTDLYRLQELRKTLTDRLLRLQLDEQTLQARRQQLQSQTNP